MHSCKYLLKSTISINFKNSKINELVSSMEHIFQSQIHKTKIIPHKNKF